MSRGSRPAAPTLLLFPTALERDRVVDAAPSRPGRPHVALCGFGPIAAAARTAQLLGRLNPRQVVLAGIAGTYHPDRHPVGCALEFSRVALHGVGAGEGARFQGPTALGFAQWAGDGAPPAPIHDLIELDPRPAAAGTDHDAGLLLTTCAASANADDVARRRERFPAAAAEDMEGFGVALACRLAGTPLRIVRGISNRAGDRDHARWQIPHALAAVRRYLADLLP